MNQDGPLMPPRPVKKKTKKKQITAKPKLSHVIVADITLEKANEIRREVLNEFPRAWVCVMMPNQHPSGSVCSVEAFTNFGAPLSSKDVEPIAEFVKLKHLVSQQKRAIHDPNIV